MEADSLYRKVDSHTKEKNQIIKEKEELKIDIKDKEQSLNLLFHEEKQLKNNLLTHYHKLLYEGKDTRRDGLSWIIKAIWNLECEVILSYLPSFLDEESIKFLFEVFILIKIFLVC